MKLFKTLFLVASLFAITSCSVKENKSATSSSSLSESQSSESGKQSYGSILKKIADDMFDYGGANRENLSNSQIKRSFDPVDENHRGPEIQLPAVLIYLSGVIGEIDNVDVVNKAFEFTGTYEFDYSISETPNWVEQTIGLTINAKMDKDNNKVFFSGLENVSMNGEVMAHSYIFVDISYNFETQELGDFKLYMDQNSLVYYFQVINGEASRMGSSTTDDEITAITNTYNSYVAEFDSLCETKVVADGELLRASEEAFVNTQKYANRLFGQKVDSVRIKEAA